MYDLLLPPSIKGYIKENLSLTLSPFKRQPHTMVKHTQTIRWQQPTHCLSVFDHFLWLALKGLKYNAFSVRFLKCVGPFWDIMH